MIIVLSLNPFPELCMVEKSVFWRCSVESLSSCLFCIKAVFLALIGFFIGGPSNMISSAISADLGRQDLVKGSSEALATVTGIVDGTGSVGAAVGQVRLPKENRGLGKKAKTVVVRDVSSFLNPKLHGERGRKRGLGFRFFLKFIYLFRKQSRERVFLSILWKQFD